MPWLAGMLLNTSLVPPQYRVYFWVTAPTYHTHALPGFTVNSGENEGLDERLDEAFGSIEGKEGWDGVQNRRVAAEPWLPEAPSHPSLLLTGLLISQQRDQWIESQWEKASDISDWCSLLCKTNTHKSPTSTKWAKKRVQAFLGRLRNWQ